jgi:hypothetical protein
MNSDGLDETETITYPLRKLSCFKGSTTPICDTVPEDEMTALAVTAAVLLGAGGGGNGEDDGGDEEEDGGVQECSTRVPPR